MKNNLAEFHVPKIKKGAGQFYGVGAKNPVGKINPTKSKKATKPPKKMA